MDLTVTQKNLFILTLASFLMVVALLLLYDRTLWLAIFSFSPLIPFGLLTLGTPMQFSNAKKIYRDFLFAIGIFQASIIEASIAFMLNYFGFTHRIISVAITMIIIIIYTLLYKSAKRNQN